MSLNILKVGVSLVILLNGLLATSTDSNERAAQSEKAIFCYWGTWANYRNGNGNFGPGHIHPHLCTHLGYAFFGITDSGELKLLDAWLDLNLGTMAEAVALKQQNRNLKVLASIGGWNEGSTKYSAMAADKAKRATFIASTLQFVQQHGFDGVDFDWEYPVQRGGNASDRQNYVVLLKELKAALSPHKLLLTVAVAASKASAIVSYDIAGMSEHVDLINVMTYDFAGSWDSVVGFNAPLNGVTAASPNTVTAAIKYWLSQGAPANKLVLGLAFYGRSFTLAGTNNNAAVGARSTGPGTPGPYTQESGFLGYNEICEKFLLEDWSRQWDATHAVPYAQRGNQWVGYDDAQSITLKIDFLKKLGLRGAMVWSIETDDFRGICGSGKFPLLMVINKQLSLTSTTTTTTTRKPSTPPPLSSETTTLTSSSSSTTGTTWLSTTTLSSVPSSCDKDGRFVNPDDCSRFFTCTSGKRYDFDCPSGLFYDQISGVCNWPALVDCNP